MPCVVVENPECAKGEDIGFVCEDSGNFRLKADACVLTKPEGFRQIPIKKSGRTV